MIYQRDLYHVFLSRVLYIALHVIPYLNPGTITALADFWFLILYELLLKTTFLDLYAVVLRFPVNPFIA
jgi:hypothetical protein